MRKLLAVISVFVLVSLLLGAAEAGFVIVPRTDAITPKPSFVIVPRTDAVTPKPQITPKPGNKSKSDSGQYMTSEGPLFLSFRADLTDLFYMFTPVDLSLDAQYHFPLVGSSGQVVGDVKVAVQNGMAIVTYLLVSGVGVEEEDEFFTFFPDIRNVPSVDPGKLQGVKLRFGIPYSVADLLNSDNRVLLYINCRVSYKTSLKGLTAFSFDDPGYISRMMALIPLMD